VLTYSRFVAAGAPDDALTVTEAHVREHLSSVATADDNPTWFAGEVEIEHRDQDGGVLVVGYLDGVVAKVPYLTEDYDPSRDDIDGGHTFTPWAGPQ